jgi:hypothetical protein
MTAPRMSAGMLCNPADAVMRPAEVRVEPRIAIRRGHALGFAPGEQRLDHGMRFAERLEPPATRVGHFDPDTSQQRFHLPRASEVEIVAVGNEPQHCGVAFVALGLRLEVVARSSADEPRDQLFGYDTPHRQAISRERRAQQLGRRFRTRGEDRSRAVAERIETRTLKTRDFGRELRPPHEPLDTDRPLAARPFGA